MKIGDAAPGALLRPSPNAGASTSFTQTLGSVQRAFQARRPAPLYEVSDRLARERQFERLRQRLDEAARVLQESSPEVEFAVERHDVIEGSDRVKTRREVTIEEEVTRPARGATQTSIAFASKDDVIFREGSKLHVQPGDGPKIRAEVGEEGASLQDIADEINTSSRNGGRVVAEVIEDGDAFRLRISTTATGADAELSIERDRFKPFPKGKTFSAIDPGLATPGQDARTETEERTEIVEGTRRVLRTREIETREQVDDAEFRARVEEFVAAYDALRSFVDEENLDVGDDAGRVGHDERVRDVSSALAAIEEELAARSSESGLTLAELGIELDSEGGGLRFEAESLDDALRRDATAVVELLNAEGGLAADVAGAIAPQDPDAEAALRELRSGLTGYLERLTEREQQLEAEADLLDLLVDELARPAESTLPDRA